MTDLKLEAIDKQIADLNTQRIARIMEIQDPKRIEVKAKYDEIAKLLGELEEMDESVIIAANFVYGASFSINHEFNVEEL